MALHRLSQVSATPPPPPAGYVILYFKTDNVLYIQGSDAVEHAIGTTNDLTDLHGDVTATGPGDALATVRGIQGNAVDTTAPTDTQFLVWNSTTSKYVPVSISGDASMNHSGALLIASVGGSTSAQIHAAELTANSGLVSYPGSGLSVNYNSMIVAFNGVVSFIPSSSLVLGGTLTNNWIYVTTSATVASGAMLPSNAVPLALFSTNMTTVTFLEDARVILNNNQVWGIVSDIQTLNATNSASDGTAERAARADHVHPVSTGTPASQTPNQSNATGSSSNLARADHIHNIPTAAPVTDLTPNTTNADGSASTFSRSDHTHAIDSGSPVSQTPDQSNSTGTAATFAKSDHIHNIPTGTPSDIGSSNAQGSASAFARQDHIHKGVHSINANAGTQEFGDLELADGAGIHISDSSGIFTISATSGTSELITSIGAGLSVNYTSGNVLINGTYTAISAGNVAVGASITNGWIYVNTSGIVASGTTLPAAAIALAQFTSSGIAVTALSDRRTFLDQNIQYGTPSVDLTATTTNSQGSNDAIARADHTHAIDTGTPASQTPNQSNATGSSSNLARADHIHNIPTAAPATQIPDQSNADGSASTFSRSDHIHNIPSGIPVQIGTANVQGSAATFALSDHVHSHGNQTSGSLHAVATHSVNGFMSSTDKTNFDTLYANNTVDVTLTPVGSSPNANAASLSGQALTLQPADQTHPGVLTTVFQTIGGAKQWFGTQTFEQEVLLNNGIDFTPYVDSTTTGSNADIAYHNSVYNRFTNASLASIASAGASGVADGHWLVFQNLTGSPITIVNNYGSPPVGSNPFLTAFNEDITIPNGGAIQIILDGANNIWRVVAGTIQSLIGTIDSQIASANGAVIIGEHLYMQSASATVPGLVNNTTQSMSGDKTFTGNVISKSLEINGTAGNGYLQLDTQSSAPATPPSTDVRIYTDQSNGLTRLRDIDSSGLTVTIHRDAFFICYNQTGSTINKGKAVYVNGVYTGGSSNAPTIALAQANSNTTAPAIGLAVENISNNSFGRVFFTGSVSGWDTSAFTNGQAVYLSPTVAGGLTATEPTSPNISQIVGYITNAAVSGSIDLSVRSPLNTSSGTYRSSFQIGPNSGTSEIDLVFANTNKATLGWNPTATFELLLPPTQGSSGTYLSNDGSGNLSWSNPLVNIDGGSPSSNYVSSQQISGGTP